MPNVFTALDRYGIPVHLSESTWIGHILSAKPFMREYLDAIKATIANPSRVYQNTNYSDGLSYWRRGMGRRRRQAQ